MAMTWKRMAVGGLLCLLPGCERSAPPPRALGPATEYAGVTFERTAEGPATSSVPAMNPARAGVEVAMAGAGGLSNSCAMHLRDPRDGRELQLVHSVIATSTAKHGDTTVTQLDRAMGDYALLPPGTDMPDYSRNLRVDCASGRALSWVAPDSVPRR